MKRKWPIIIAAVFLVLLSPILFRKRTVPLVSNGKTIAIAKRSFLPALEDSQADIYVGKQKIFSVWEDVFDAPIFIYPFADGQRFLCDYDYDVAILVFIVDLNASGTNGPDSKWPLNDQLRAELACMATNVVFETKGVVRLPSYAELQEVSSNLASLTQNQFKTSSFPSGDLGLYRF